MSQGADERDFGTATSAACSKRAPICGRLVDDPAPPSSRCGNIWGQRGDVYISPLSAASPPHTHFPFDEIPGISDAPGLSVGFAGLAPMAAAAVSTPCIDEVRGTPDAI